MHASMKHLNSFTYYLLVVDEEIPPYYVKRFECLEKRYINVTNYYYLLFAFILLKIHVFRICINLWKLATE